MRRSGAGDRFAPVLDQFHDPGGGGTVGHGSVVALHGEDLRASGFEESDLLAGRTMSGTHGKRFRRSLSLWTGFELGLVVPDIVR